MWPRERSASRSPGREVKLGPDGEVLVRGAVISGATWENGALRPREDEWLATGDIAERRRVASSNSWAGRAK